MGEASKGEVTSPEQRDLDGAAAAAFRHFANDGQRAALLCEALTPPGSPRAFRAAVTVLDTEIDEVTRLKRMIAGFSELHPNRSPVVPGWNQRWRCARSRGFRAPRSRPDATTSP